MVLLLMPDAYAAFGMLFDAVNAGLPGWRIRAGATKVSITGGNRCDRPFDALGSGGDRVSSAYRVEQME